MAFNFLSFCNNEDSTTYRTRNANREYSKLDDSTLSEKEEEIIRLKRELNEEQERSEQFSSSNNILTQQIKSLKQQLTQYIEQNTETRETQYDAAKIQQLLQEKQAELIRIKDDYAKSQEKVSKLRDELEQSKNLLNEETMAHQQLQKQIQQIQNEYNTSIDSYKSQLDQQMQQFEDLQKKYRDIETQRNELLTKSNDDTNNNNNYFLEQLEEYQMQCKQKDDIISELKLQVLNFENIQKNDTSKQEIAELQEKLSDLNEENENLKDKQQEIEEQLTDETRRADGMQDLMETKSLDMMRLKDEIERLKEEIKNLKKNAAPLYEIHENMIDINTTTLHKSHSSSATNTNITQYIAPLKPFKLPIDYFLLHLDDYQNERNILIEIWNKVDIDGNDQILINRECLDIIFKAFIDLIKVTYITENIDNGNNYNMEDKKSVDIFNETQILDLKIDFQRGVMNRPFIQNKQIFTKKQFIAHFINCIKDIEYNNKIDDDGNNYNNMDDAKDDKHDIFDQLDFITTGPTILGINSNIFNAQEYVTKINIAIDKETNNDKEKVKNIVDILIKCNDKQRKEISMKCIVLMDKFKLYSNNKNVLKLLELMLKPLSECDAEWMNQAINKKDEDIVIEILFTRTNKQISELNESYGRIFDSDLSDDISAAFNRKDEEFVIMCQTLIELKKRSEQRPNEVNKKWANNDAKRIKEYLIDNQNNLNNEKAWNILYDIVVNRSWSHLNVINNTFETQTRISLIYQLKKANASKSFSRKAVMMTLQSASSMHQLFANGLKESMSSKGFSGLNDDDLQRILLCRSQIDLADINHEFTNNKQYGDGKTTRQWIEENTQSSLYQYILLSLLGLSDIQLTDNMLSIGRGRSSGYGSDGGEEKEKEENGIPQHYRDGLITYNPSIVEKPLFNAAKDANQMASWINKDFETKLKGDKGALKERLANMLTSRNGIQRGMILSKYPNIMEDITKKLKKGHVVTLCDGFLKPSIAAYDASIIHKSQMNNDINKIGDILCTKNNTEIKQIIAEYKRLYYNSDLIKKISDLCEKNKRGSVRIILDSLLKCKRNETDLNVDKNATKFDVDFLINTKKFKSDEKKRFVEIFCNKNWKYIREINRQYGMRSTSVNLEKLIQDKLGSGSGYFTLVLLKYSCDPTEYFAQKLFELGSKFDKNKDEIGRIFLTRSQIDLNHIRIRFAKKQYGTQLDKWIQDKSKNSKFGFFLTQTITSIDRHKSMMIKKEQFRKESTAPNIKQQQRESLSPHTVNNNDNNNNNMTPRRISSKPNYNNFDLQDDILNNDTKREESLQLFSSENGGLIKFCKSLKPQTVEKVWSKFDAQNRGYIEITGFPDLIATLVILYKVKLHQQTTKTKTKPKGLDTKQIRTQCEHIAVWIAKTFIYTDNQFKLTLDSFQNKFASWCQEYIDVDGVLMDF